MTIGAVGATIDGQAFAGRRRYLRDELVVRRRLPAGLMEERVQLDDRQAEQRAEPARERCLAGAAWSEDDDARPDVECGHVWEQG